MGSTWGNAIKISVFGESHGAGIGVVIDGFPSGVDYDEAFVLREMERRAPGRNKQSTQRKEADLPVIQSGAQATTPSLLHSHVRATRTTPAWCAINPATIRAAAAIFPAG